MIVEVINTGTELLLGDIVNTNFQYLSHALNNAGFDVLYQTTVGDNAQRLLSILSIALNRADIVVTTGGLGPTRGDITKEVVAQYLRLPLVLNTTWLNKLNCYFAKHGRVMSENNKKQAMVPQGAELLNNEQGTAPGLVLKTASGKLMFLLPGPPAEMQHVCDKQMLPYLQKVFADQGVIHSRVLHLRGLGESTVAERLDKLITAQTNPTLALYARKGEIILRITAKAKNLATAEDLNLAMEKKVRTYFPTEIFGTDDDTLASVLGQALLAKHATIAFAESCTGGLASSLITDVPGSSAYLLGSVVSYSNMAKAKVLQVEQTTLDKYGAVSEEVAKQMAEGVRQLYGTTLGVSITGIAGPGGATATNPVGLVYIAVADAYSTKCEKCNFNGSRTTNKMRSAMTAFSLAYDKLKTSTNN